MKPKFHNPARTRPEETDGLHVPYAPAKRKPPKWRWYAILLVVSSPLFFFAGRGVYNVAIVSAPGNVILKEYELRAATSGFVKQLDVNIGDLIEEQQRLVQLSDPKLVEKRIRLERELASLSRTIPEDSPAVLDVLDKQRDLAHRMLAERRDNLGMLNGLFQQGAATIAEVNLAKAQVIEAEANLHRAEADLAQELNRSRPAEDSSYANAVQRIQTELQLVEFRSTLLPHHSSYSGRVIDVFVSEGEFVNEGTPLLMIGRLTQPDIIAYLEPKYAKRIKSGSAATVTFPDNTKLTAYVVRRPALTKRMPPELVTTFGQRPMSVMLTLHPDQPWPEQNLIHGLPLTIRFHYDWETTVRADRKSGTSQQAPANLAMP